MRRGSRVAVPSVMTARSCCEVAESFPHRSCTCLACASTLSARMHPNGRIGQIVGTILLGIQGDVVDTLRGHVRTRSSNRCAKAADNGGGALRRASRGTFGHGSDQ